MDGTCVPVLTGKRPTSNRRARGAVFLPTRKLSSDYIFIPPDLRATPVLELPIACARLSSILARTGIKTLGDLHGLRLADFLQYRNCGRRTVAELEALVQRVQGSFTSADLLRAPSFANPRNPNLLSVTPAGRDLAVSELPLSPRAQQLIRWLGTKYLSDLNGEQISKLLGWRNCGAKTVSEILSLIERANAGAFDTGRESLKTLTPFALLSGIETALSQLPERNRQAVTLRLGGADLPPMSLAGIGARLNLSKERVRQIVWKTLHILMLEGGPRSRFVLDKIASDCRDTVCPLTPDLLQHWLPDPWPLRWTPAFYVRLIANMRPDIPAWLDGASPDQIPDHRSRAVAEALEAMLRQRARKLPLPEALKAVRRAPKLGKLSAYDFLLALSRTKLLRVQFPRPDRPEVGLASPAQSVIRRWFASCP